MCSSLVIGAIAFSVLMRVVLEEVFDSSRVMQDSSDSSNHNDPNTVSRLSSLGSSNSNGNRGEWAEMIWVSSRSFNVEGFNCGVSCHGEHVSGMIRSDGNIMDEIGKWAVV